MVQNSTKADWLIDIYFFTILVVLFTISLQSEKPVEIHYFYSYALASE